MKPRLLIGKYLIFMLIMCQCAITHSQEVKLTDEDKQSQEKIARMFVTHLEGKDFENADLLININAYVKLVAEIVFDKEGDQNDFATGFKNAAKEKSFSFTRDFLLATVNEEIDVVYLGFNKTNHIIVRIDFISGGHEYMKLLINRDLNQDWLIDDFELASTTRRLSQSHGEQVQKIVLSDQSLLQKVFGVNQVNESLVKEFQLINNLQKAGKIKEAHDLLLELPEEIKNTRGSIMFAIQLSQNIDDETYRNDLSRFAQYFGSDPKSAFMLIDHYFFEEDWDSALEAIDVSSKIWWDDAAFSNLKVSILLSSDRYEEASIELDRAIQIEPEFESSYWLGIDINVEIKQFAKAVKLMELLESDFGYDFDANAFIEDKSYSDFVNSNEFKAWQEKRS